ncbi:MAG: aminotransferase class V-fold PLP-dependent enzyme [Lachnospiraceae bacterium]|nr:aminotransferase class V-fold PLP-dependent enzyme [Lachnospiraceae bacterium]
MIDKKLETYSKTDNYPFHMPGHKRQAFEFENPYKIDITEITGFDNLHHPEEELKDLEEGWAKLYGAAEAFFMVNGSTGGILTAIFSAIGAEDELLLARNCHGSAYHGAYLKDTKVHFIYPEFIETKGGTISGGISPKKLEDILKANGKIKAFLLTSPTYEGIISNVSKLAEVAHRFGVILIVDGAHGAHLGICNSKYENPIQQGADLVILSLHKTLPAFTSTALLLKSKGCKINNETIRFYLDCFETSSPSYILMASGAKCLRYLEEEGKKAFLNYEKRLEDFYRDCKDLTFLKLLDRKDKDAGKIVISGEGYVSGQEIFSKLRDEFHLELEMAAGGYCIAMTSIMDQKEGFHRLKEALFSIEQEIKENQRISLEAFTYPKTVSVLSMKEAIEGQKVRRPLESALNCISAGFVDFYPPGIPILAPGELITEEIIKTIKAGMKGNLNVEGCSDKGILIVE